MGGVLDDTELLANVTAPDPAVRQSLVRSAGLLRGAKFGLVPTWVSMAAGQPTISMSDVQWSLLYRRFDVATLKQGAFKRVFRMVPAALLVQAMGFECDCPCPLVKFPSVHATECAALDVADRVQKVNDDALNQVLERIREASEKYRNLQGLAVDTAVQGGLRRPVFPDPDPSSANPPMSPEAQKLIG